MLSLLSCGYYSVVFGCGGLRASASWSARCAAFDLISFGFTALSCLGRLWVAPWARSLICAKGDRLRWQACLPTRSRRGQGAVQGAPDDGGLEVGHSTMSSRHTRRAAGVRRKTRQIHAGGQPLLGRPRPRNVHGRTTASLRRQGRLAIAPTGWLQ